MSSPFFFNTSIFVYLAASVLYIIYLTFRNEKIGLAATLVTFAGFLSHTAAIGLRWAESYQMGFGRIPLSNMYESMVFWSWSIVLIYLIFERIYKNRSLGALVTPLAFLAIASISIAPSISQEIEPLVPALQSKWLHVHVITSFLGYAAFAISFAVSIIYLVLSSEKRNDTFYFIGMASLVTTVTVIAAVVVDFVAAGVAGQPHTHLFAASFASTRGAVKLVSWIAAGFFFVLLWYLGSARHDLLVRLFPGKKVLDDLSYKTVMVGFPLLTIGIVTGAAWANYAWGTYWSWDPKETWSLITWFIYAAFLHARFTAGWKGRKTAVLSVVGFAAVVFTYIGVNFVLSGLHSYA